MPRRSFTLLIEAHHSEVIASVRIACMIGLPVPLYYLLWQLFAPLEAMLT